MNNFTFHTPTEIIFGKGAEAETSALIQKYGGSRILVIIGGGSVIRSGLLKRLEGQLRQNRIAYRLHGGVKPNPVASHVREGIKAALDFGADFILAVGGGSVIDEAKAIAHGTKNPQTDFWAFWEGEAELTASLPIGTVLTIAAAGSETSASAVITNKQTGRKRGLTTPFNRPCFAVMNPELTFTLPKDQIACGIVDILMHTLERYFINVGSNRLTDEIAEGLMRTVIENGRIALGNPSDYDAMSELMWCGSLSHNGLTGLGRPSDFSVHQMGHELSARYDVSHGASLSAVWGGWAEHCRQDGVTRFAQYARKVWGIEDRNDDEAAKDGIGQTLRFFKEIGMPVCLPELNIGTIDEETVLDLAERCTYYGKRAIGQLKPLDAEGIAEVYRKAGGGRAIISRE